MAICCRRNTRMQHLHIVFCDAGWSMTNCIFWHCFSAFSSPNSNPLLQRAPECGVYVTLSAVFGVPHPVASEGPFWSTFFRRTKIACGTMFLHFDRQILPIFLASFFYVTLLLPPFLGRYALAYHESLCDVFFPCCLHFKAHLLYIFRMSVEHFPSFSRIFPLYWNDFLLFTLWS